MHPCIYTGICLRLRLYNGRVCGEHKSLWHPKNTWRGMRKVPLLQQPNLFAAATIWSLFVFVLYVLRDNAGLKDSVIVLATVYITTYPTRPSGTIKKARLCCVVWSVLQSCELFSYRQFRWCRAETLNDMTGNGRTFPDCDLCCLKWYVAPRSYCTCVRVAPRVRWYCPCRRLWQI